VNIPYDPTQDIVQGVLLLVMLTPFIFTLLIANLSLHTPELRWLAYGLIALLSVGFLMAGALSLIAGQMYTQVASSLPPLPIAPNWSLLGIASMGTGLVALLVLTPPVRALVGRLLPSLEPANPLHSVSLSLAAFLVGMTATQLALLGDLEALADLNMPLGLAQIWAQGIGLTLVGLAGIGLGTRRNGRETAARLGLAPIRGRTLIVAAVSIVCFMALDLAWSQGWQRLDPQGLEAVSRVSATLFGSLINLPGALSIGITAAISEEIIYRGALLPRFGLLLTTALFAISHVQYGLSPAVVEVFIIGLALGLIRRRWDLTTCILIHFGYNTLNLLLLPPQL